MPDTDKPKSALNSKGLPRIETGRKTKLTAELQAEAVKYLKQGQFVETVCSFLKIGKSTWWEWMRKGEAGMQPYAEFRDAIEEAHAAAEMRVVTYVAKAVEDDPELALKWLQRRYPRKFAVEYQEHAYSGEVTQRQELGITVSFADPARRAAVRTILDALTAGRIRAGESGGIGVVDGRGAVDSGESP